MTDPRLAAEFYRRLTDAQQCPACALDFIAWMRDGGFDIGEAQDDGVAPVVDAYYHAELIGFERNPATDPAGLELMIALREVNP